MNVQEELEKLLKKDVYMSNLKNVGVDDAIAEELWSRFYKTFNIELNKRLFEIFSDEDKTSLLQGLSVDNADDVREYTQRLKNITAKYKDHKDVAELLKASLVEASKQNAAKVLELHDANVSQTKEVNG